MCKSLKILMRDLSPLSFPPRESMCLKYTCIELEPVNHTNIRSMTSKNLDWHTPLERTQCHTIQDETYVLHAQKLAVSRGATGVKLDIFVAPLSRIMLLLMGFGLTILDAEIPKDAIDLVRNLDLCTVANQNIHCAPLPDCVPEGLDEVRVSQ